LERVARLQDISAGLAGAATPAEVADIILREGVRALGAGAGVVGVCSEEGLHLELIRVVGYPPESAAAWRRVPLSADVPLCEAARAGTPIFLESLRAWTEQYTGLRPTDQSNRAWACLPMIAHGRPLGAFGLAFPEERTFPPDERAFMVTVARLCAQALERARLYEAAEVRNRENEQFLAVLSHELRTPLTAILGWIQILRSKPFDAALLERALKVMDRNARSEVRLIDDILDVSRMVANKLPLSMRAADLNAIAQAAADVVVPEAEAKAVAVEIALDPAPLLVLADVVRLQQVIGNLLSNAVRFTPKGGKVRVETVRVGDQARVLVRDNGQGIDPDLLPHVFERFRQGDSSTTRAHGGLGLGLTIARHLVEQHGGTLAASSAGVGLGATFTASIPAAPASEPTRGSDPGSERRRTDAERAPRLPGVRVVVVDDEADNAELVGELLRGQGATVALATSSRQALAILTEAPFDVLLCDISMPQEDGYTLLRKARALAASRGRALPAAALTAHSGADDVARCLSAGFHAHLGKPLDLERLVSTVADLAGLPG
jgi:signal transduction histidine kinase/CheY-like chemotaxis protein